MKSNFQLTSNRKKITLSKVNFAAILCQAITIVALIISFIISKFIPELTNLWQSYVVLLAVIMAYTSYSIYKKISLSIIYLGLGLIMFLSIIFGI